MNDDKDFEQALFRFSLISPLLHIDDEDEKKRIMDTILKKELDIPNSLKRKLTVKTIENYLKQYQEEGFEGLKRKERNDRGILKRISDEVLNQIIALKKEEPRRSARRIINIIQTMPEYREIILKERTVSRILKNRGLVRKNMGPKKIIKSFEMEHINDLWEGDISEGLFIRSTAKKTYLFAFIDDFSRVIPHAQFYYDEKLPRLEDCLKKAILKRGIPKALYVDNGKVFISNHLKRICAELGIRLIHHLPYSPQSKGKIERFFLRMKQEFLLEAQGSDIQSIEELNSYFFSWLEIEYHRREHNAIGVTPLDRFTKVLPDTPIRTIESMEEITGIFMYREKRKVNPKVGHIKLNGNIYQTTDVMLFGKEIEIRFDPYDMSRLFIYDNGIFRETVCPLDMKNMTYQKIPEENSINEGKIRSSSVEFFARLKQKEQELHKKESQRIDFTKLKMEE